MHSSVTIFTVQSAQCNLHYVHTFNDIVKIQSRNTVLLTLKLASIGKVNTVLLTLKLVWARKVNKESGSYDYCCSNNIKGYQEGVLFCLQKPCATSDLKDG